MMALMELPERSVVHREFLPKYGDDCGMLRKTQAPTEQKSLRCVEHRIVGT